MRELVLEQLECSGLLLSPIERHVLLDDGCQWCGNGAEVGHKSTIKSSKPMKAPHLIHVGWNRPIANCFHLLFIHLDSICTHHKTKKNNTRSAKRALLEVS
ncbi:unnamed protein product, partial [Linum tenue]